MKLNCSVTRILIIKWENANCGVVIKLAADMFDICVINQGCKCMTAAHWTLAKQNLLMSDQSLTVVGHNVRTLFFTTKKKKKKGSFSLKVAYVYPFLYVRPHFCFGNQNSDLAGHSPYKRKKIICSPDKLSALGHTHKKYYNY